MISYLYVKIMAVAGGSSKNNHIKENGNCSDNTFNCLRNAGFIRIRKREKNNNSAGEERK